MNRYLLLLLAFLGAPAFSAVCAPETATVSSTGTRDATITPCTNVDFPDLDVPVGADVERYAPYYIWGCESWSDSAVWSGTFPTGVSIDSSTGVLTVNPTGAGVTASSVTCTNSLGAETHNFTITVTEGTMKWNPGFYPLARQQESQFDSGDAAVRVSHYDILQGSSAVGVGLYMGWRDVEPTQGNYDFTALLTDIAAAKARGLRYAIVVDDRTEFNIPAYIWNGSCRLGTTDQWRHWNSTCRGHFKNMLTALCAAVESEPYVELIMLPKETALGTAASGQDGTYSLAGYVAGLQDSAAHARAQCPTTNIILSANSFSGGSAVAQIEALIDWGVANGIGHGAPDTAPRCVGDDPEPCTFESDQYDDSDPVWSGVMHYDVLYQNVYAGQIPIAMRVEPSEQGTGAVGLRPAYLPSTHHDFGVNGLGASHMLVVRNTVCSSTFNCDVEFGDSTKWLGTGGDGLTDGILFFYNNTATWPNDACPTDYVANRGGCLTGDE